MAAEIMASGLRRGLAGLQLGGHACLIYDDRAERLRVVVPYITIGLARAERCLYVSDGSSAEELTEALSDAGVDVRAQVSRGALSIRAAAEAGTRSRGSDRQFMIGVSAETVAEAIRAGFSGLRIALEMTPARSSEPPRDRLLQSGHQVQEILASSRAMFPAAGVRIDAHHRASRAFVEARRLP